MTARTGSDPNLRRRRTTTRRIAALLAIALVVAACSGDDGDTTAEGDVGGDLVERVAVEPGPNSVLSAVVRVETVEPASVSVRATGPDGHEVVTPATEVASEHEVPLLGLRAESTYALAVVAEGADGTREDVEAGVDIETAALPDELPELEVTADPERVSPGVTVFNLMYWGPADDDAAPAADDAAPADDDAEADADTPNLRTGWLVGVDESGQVVWYYRSELQILDATPTPRGTLLLGVDDAVVREIDLLGNTLAEWGSRIVDRVGTDFSGQTFASEGQVPVEMDSSHHDVHELANGNLITLSTELIELPDDVASDLCPADPANHAVGDVVVEFTREGEVVGEWPLSAVYEPARRPGSDMCPEEINPIAPPNWFYPDVEGERDWTHGNAVILDEADNTLVVSLRHLDAIVGLRYQDDDTGGAGELLWELGPGGDLTMEGDGLFPYHQHAPELRDDGTLLVYDNGNARPGNADAGGDTPPFSRAVIYDVDPGARTVRQVWEHRDENAWGGPTFAPFLSDADPMENGNVLITHGAVNDPDQVLFGRIVEVVPDLVGGGADDEIVFDLVTVSARGEGWTIYRAEKLPSLYP